MSKSKKKTISLPKEDPKLIRNASSYKGGNRSGGVNISGSSVMIGGDVVGRDKVTNVTTGIPRDELNQLFVPLMNAISTAPLEKQKEAVQMAEELKNKVAKGKDASDGAMAKLVDGLIELVPSAASSVLSIFATPILGEIAGPVTKYVLDKIQQKLPE